MASTLLNEQGWNPDAIERQLSHLEKKEVRAAYNYAQYLPERRRMMQAWSDHLDVLASSPVASANVLCDGIASNQALQPRRDYYLAY